MNIGWIFVICALLILVLMAFRPWHKDAPVASRERDTRENGPDTEGHLPITEAPGEEVRRSILAGNKIRAIKLYREQTGLGLREAKAAIDHLEQVLRQGMEQV
jgi:ribosomal protein L7/L12